MLRIVFTASPIAYSWPVDPSAEFEPGMVCQLGVEGNRVVGTVSNGTAPIGIIDDIKTKAFSATSWDEEIWVPVTNAVVGPNGNLITPLDIKAELANPNIVASSFVSRPVRVQLIPRNGVIVFPAGTELNFDAIGSGTYNAIKTIVRYTYNIPNIVGDDSTQGSGRVSVWIHRFIGQTDKYETNQVYPINANLFVSEEGLLTTRQPMPNYPSVAIVTASPNSLLGSLEFMWL